MIDIIPSLLVESRDEFEHKLRLVEHDVDTIHVDVLDGTLFPNTTWFDAVAVGALTMDVNVELHLMVENPLPIIRAWHEHVKTLKRAIVHAEMERPVGAVVSEIREHLRLEAGVALSPPTPLHQIEDVFHTIDHLTIMGVHPGSSGQDFKGEFIYKKIERAHRHRPELPIEIDGGVTDERLQPLIAAGCTRICSASLLFTDPDPRAKLQSLKDLL